MILEHELGDAAAAENRGPVTARERRERLGQQGGVLFAPVDVTLARSVERILFDQGLVSLVVDARELSEGALGETIVRCVEAGLAIVAIGAPAAVQTAVTAKLSGRAVTAAAAPAAQLAASLAELCLEDPESN